MGARQPVVRPTLSLPSILSLSVEDDNKDDDEEEEGKEEEKIIANDEASARFMRFAAHHLCLYLDTTFSLL